MHKTIPPAQSPGCQRPFLYESVFAQVSFQFCGHLDEYLITRTQHLGLFYFQTRFGHGKHILRIYEAGTLVSEKHFRLSHNIFLYYFLNWFNWFRELRHFSIGKQNVFALFTHPLQGFALSIIRHVKSVFWQWDYFPDGSFTSRLFNAVARFYATRATRYYAVSEAICRAMNRSLESTVMLGVRPPQTSGDIHSKRLLLVGQLRSGQGVESILEFLSTHSEYQLALMGAPTDDFGRVIAQTLQMNHLSERVYFPGHFVNDQELRDVAATCFAAVALYDTNPKNFTHYADPGKVKSAIEMGLPVVMTRISGSASVVEEFHAGEIIDGIEDLDDALANISGKPAFYFEGCRTFAHHFNYETYYAQMLQFDSDTQTDNEEQPQIPKG